MAPATTPLRSRRAKRQVATAVVRHEIFDPLGAQIGASELLASGWVEGADLGLLGKTEEKVFFFGGGQKGDLTLKSLCFSASLLNCAFEFCLAFVWLFVCLIALFFCLGALFNNQQALLGSQPLGRPHLGLAVYHGVGEDVETSSCGQALRPERWAKLGR